MMRGVCTDRPPDPVLGDLLARLDPPTVLDALREQMVDVPRATREGWRSIVALDAAYHPRRHVRMVFALLSDPGTPPERYWPESDLVYLHAPVRAPMSRRGQILHLGGETVEAYRFPDDRRLRGLRKFASTVFAPRMWQQWIDSSGGGMLNAATLQRRFVRYVPEEKWIVRLRGEVSLPGVEEPAKRRIAVRCTSPKACVTLARRQSAVADALANSKNVRVPSLIGAEKAKGLLAVEWDRGDPLLDVFRGDESAIEGFVRSLRTFHGMGVADLPLLTLGRMAQSAAAMADELSLVCPDRATALAELAGDLTTRLEETGSDAPMTLHNDLHLRQVLVKRGRFTFLDLERMSCGDPLIDAANFAAQLSILPHRPEDNVEYATAESWRAGFLACWSNLGGSVNEAKLGALTAAALLKLAHGAMRHLRPGWRNHTGVCVRMARQELAGRREPAGVS